MSKVNLAFLSVAAEAIAVIRDRRNRRSEDVAKALQQLLGITPWPEDIYFLLQIEAEEQQFLASACSVASSITFLRSHLSPENVIATFEILRHEKLEPEDVGTTYEELWSYVEMP